MNRFNTSTTALVCLLALTISGCDSIPFIDNTPDYKSSGRSRPLEVPPDLTSASASDTFSVPGGGTTYSSFNKEQEGQEVGVEKILPTSDSVRMERAGAQRWLVVDAPAEKIWPMIREFWTDQGFAVRVENPETGVMETEWIDKGDLKKDEKGNYLDKFQGWLDKLSNTADRQKFRTRIDRGSNEGTTEIYMTHRTVSSVPDDGKERVRTGYGEVETGYRLEDKTKNKAANALDDDVDVELLRRLMVKLGVEEKKSRSIIASPSQEQRATLNKEAEGSVNLVLNDQFDRSWRRVGLALDRIGFVVEDKDRSRGLFYVRYSDVDIDDTPKEKKGLLDKLKFWGDDTDKKEEAKPAPVAKDDKGLLDKLKFWGGDSKDKVNPEKQYRIKVESSDDDKTSVTVADKDGARNRSPIANRIISLLYEQLK